MVEFQAGRIDATEHQKLEAGVEKGRTRRSDTHHVLQAGAANTTVQQNFATLSTALTDLLNSGVLGIKNAQSSQQLLKVAIQTAQAILANVSSLLSAPTTTTLPATKGAKLTCPMEKTLQCRRRNRHHRRQSHSLEPIALDLVKALVDGLKGKVRR